MARVQYTRDRYARDLRTKRRSSRNRRASDQRSEDRRTRDYEARDQWAWDSRGVSPKRRRTTDGRGGTSREEDRQRDYEPLGYKALEEICKASSPEDGTLDLLSKEERFNALLNYKNEIDLGRMQLLIRSIHLCCSTKCVSNHSEHLLRLVIEAKFLGTHISSFLSRMLSFSRSNEQFRPSDVISYLADIFLEMLKRFGREIVHSIPIAQLNDTFVELKNRKVLHRTGTLEEKVGQVKALHKELISQERKSILNQEDQIDLKPPGNFRDLSVIPRAEDLSVGTKPFLRVNVVNGCYKDLDHYLDVQFRLLREDCISPLRDGIMQLRKDCGNLGTSGASGHKIANDVYVYREVSVLYPVCSRKGMVYRIRFDSFHYSVRHVNWEKCKRFKFGSLLCLSADDFYTLLFATVENRDANELHQGELEVRFENVELEDLKRFIETKERFDMVESPAFFEAYRHVLEALKDIDPHDGFPFKEHIVHCSQRVMPPDHEEITNGYYDLTGIAQDGENDGIDSVSTEFTWETRNSSFLDDSDIAMESDNSNATSDHRVILDVYDLQYDRDRLEFNDSQLRAFQMALTKRFAVIQGPPGTGKTYVGLKIAQVLLQTSSLWEEEEERTSILMVSYTNHALDQFLEGLLPTPGKLKVIFAKETAMCLKCGAHACSETLTIKFDLSLEDLDVCQVNPNLSKEFKRILFWTSPIISRVINWRLTCTHRYSAASVTVFSQSCV